MVADTIGVNRSTARSILARYIREGGIAERSRGGANNIRVDNEMKDCLNDILNDNCMLTLAQINQELDDAFRESLEFMIVLWHEL